MKSCAIPPAKSADGLHFLGLSELFFDGLAFTAQPALFQGVRHGQTEAIEPVFQQIIADPPLDAFGNQFIAQRARNDDVRNIEFRFLQRLERVQAVELRQVVVGEDDVDGWT